MPTKRHEPFTKTAPAAGSLCHLACREVWSARSDVDPLGSLVPPTAPLRAAPLGRGSYPGPQPTDWAPAGYAAVADRPAVLALVVVAWSAAGVSIAVALGRRGHELASWGALGVVFGPLLAGLAAGAARVRSSIATPIEVAPGHSGPGDVHVLVAVLGDPAAAADAAPVLRWFGGRLGDVALARPVTVEALAYEDRDERAEAERALAQAALFVTGPMPRLLLAPGGRPQAVAACAAAVDAAVVVLAGGDARDVSRCARRLRGRTVIVTPAAGPGGGRR